MTRWWITGWCLACSICLPLGCRSTSSDSSPLSSWWGKENESELIGSNSNEVVAALQERKNKQESNWAKKLWDPVQQRIGDATTTPAADELEGDRLSLDNESSPTPLLYCGVAAYAERQGNLEQARVFYEKGLALDARHLESRLGLARVAQRQAEPALAASSYATALQYHPNSPAVHNDLGLFHQSQGRMDQARTSLEQAVRLSPDNRRYRNNLAALWVAERRPDLAEEILSEVADPVASCITIAEFAERQGERDLAENYRLRARAQLVSLPADHPAHRYFAQRDRLTTTATSGVTSAATSNANHESRH